MIRSSADSEAPHDAPKWLPVVEPMDGVFLVTNNMDSRTASGHMSHVWIAPFGITAGEGIEGPFTCLTDGYPARVCGVTHYQRIEPLAAKAEGREP